METGSARGGCRLRPWGLTLPGMVEAQVRPSSWVRDSSGVLQNCCVVTGGD